MKKKYFMKYSVELVNEDECKYNNDKITSPTQAYDKFIEVFKLNKKAEEYLVMFCLNSKNDITGAFLVSKGGLNYAYINIADIIKRTLLCNSQKIIIAHNHPSGNVEPSREDRNSTDRLTKACEIMGIELLDHLIIGNNQYQSIKSYSKN